ncbi:anillin isoform X2 [Cimex lectularius]|uniref:PH domain-containing protein n=1 Tax=Cimex lectularius TaxID=79782 RepID=A0A8I6RGP5_CIMLE|nr:anillin isoform X2 [Cimex lectularius]
MDFSDRLIARSELKRAELKKHMEEELTDSENDQFKAVISTRHEIVVKRNKKQTEEDKENSTSNGGHLSKVTNERLQKLSSLYSDQSPGPSSPIHKPHVRFSPSHEESCSDGKPRGKDRLAEARAQRLAALAKVINNWEDQSDKKVNFKIKDPETKTIPVLKDAQPLQSQKFLRPSVDKTCNNYLKTSPSKSPLPQKNVGWDNKIIQSLEAQGYQRCDSQQHLIYDYKSPHTSPVKCSTNERNTKHQTPEVTTSPVKEKSPPKRFISPKKNGPAVMELAAKYSTSPNKTVKDPTELSIMERKALFEKNKGDVILPKVPFGTPVPAKILASSESGPKLTSSKFNQVQASQATQNVKVPGKLSWNKITPSPTDRPRDKVTESILERQQEIEELKNRWEKRRAGLPGLDPSTTKTNVEENNHIPKPPPMPPLESYSGKRIWAHTVSNNDDDSPTTPHKPQQCSSPKRIRMGTLSPVRGMVQDEVVSPIERKKSYTRSPRKSDGYIGLNEIKPIRISPPKPGRLYPSVSDIETESDALDSEHDTQYSEHNTDESDGNSSGSGETSISLGQAIIEASRISKTSFKRASNFSNNNSNTMTDSLSEQESKVMHEMDDFLDEALGGVSPPKRSKESFSSETEPSLSSHPSSSTMSDSFKFFSEESNKKPITLVHTVSMYRKQGTLATPVKKEIRVHENVRDWDQPKEEIPEEIKVKERVKELENEMVKQTTIISQASQALNLCHSRIEFTGSPEQVEAERLLLLATSRRVAAMHEIERLKVEKKLKPGPPPQDHERGDLTIEQLTLPIKPVPCSMEKVDNFVCLATCGATVLATQALPASRRENRILFTKPLKFEKLYPDFTITLEVYRLSTESSSDFIPHEVKYGIDRKKDKLRLTPQKKSNKTQRVVESPGGPNAVRSPAFQLVGFAVFSLREINRTKFSLSKVPYGAPIDGSLEVKMTTQLKTDLVYKGFLTLFEEISGFGAWRRRWGVLSGTIISLWAYPEHENEKIPIDTIDLSQCLKREVGLVSRDVCARPHTFVLENIGGTRHLVSADSIEDRIGWCKAINKSLYLLSAWGNQTKH